MATETLNLLSARLVGQTILLLPGDRQIRIVKVIDWELEDRAAGITGDMIYVQADNGEDYVLSGGSAEVYGHGMVLTVVGKLADPSCIMHEPWYCPNCGEPCTDASGVHPECKSEFAKSAEGDRETTMIGHFLSCPQCNNRKRKVRKINNANPRHPDPTETYTLTCGHTVI